MRSRSVLALALLTALAGCSERPDAVGSVQQPNLFGADDRVEWYAHPDPMWQDVAARSIGGWIPDERVDLSDPTDVLIGSRGSHRMVHDLCAGEAFEDQPVSVSCTGVIIDDDLVATAGHCFDQATDCQDRKFVVGWYYTAADTFRTLTQDNVYSCREVLVQDVDSVTGFDHAIVRLDRPIARGLRPVPVRYTVEDIPLDTPVVLPSHGAGLPLKIDSGGRVVAWNPQFFETTADTFGGASGAGVFDATGTVLGLHVRGPTDYIEDMAAGCSRVNRLDDDPTRTNGGDASHIAIPVQQLCADPMVDSALCDGTAGDTICRDACDCPTGTTCEVQDGNITCVTECTDDTECADGFTCESGWCRAGPGCLAGDVWERDVCSRPLAFMEACGPDEICDTGACIPALPGDTCNLAEDLGVNNRFIPVDIVNEPYRNIYQGSCGAFGPDRVWRLNVDRDTTLRVSGRHMGYRIHIREGDCEDPGAEIACSATNRPEIEIDLTPGTYYVFLDADLFTNVPTTIDFIFDPDVLPMNDGGPVLDAGPPADAGPMDDGGCDCAVGARSASRGWIAGLLALGLFAYRRRRGRARA